MVHVAIAGLFILAIAGGVGFGVASADSSDDLARAGAFGFDEATHQATLAHPARSAGAAESSSSQEQSALASASLRDISAGLQMVDEREAEAKERAEAENAAAIERVAAGKSKQGVASSEKEKASETSEAPSTEGGASSAKAEAADSPAQVVEYNLPAVDWSVGKEAFVGEWTARIDAYLQGSTLEGYGSVFAEAAWENGVDPRWSPAISNTESTKGSHCFLPHNAWGWGADAWPDWTTAIKAHVAGLAEVYGYSLTPTAAQVYCPPNHVNWYNNTLNQMSLI